MTPSLTQRDVLAALRAFLLAILPAQTEVVQGQANRVPMPQDQNFVIMTPGRREQLGQTVHEWTAPTAPAPASGTDEITRSTALHIQLDVYGPTSADNAQIITTLLRDGYGFDFLTPFGLAPLYGEDPFQMPLVAGEQQWLQRWTIRIALHGTIAVSVAADFADTLITTLSEVSHGS